MVYMEQFLEKDQPNEKLDTCRLNYDEFLKFVYYILSVD